MAGKTDDFKVRISAEDKTSGTLSAINKRMAAINKEVARARKPFDQLAVNYRKFTSVTGLDKITSGMAGVARSGFDAFRSVMRIVEPLAAITGAASIAGMVRLATAWADFGSQLGNTAARAALTSEQMMDLQNAGRLAGVSAQTMSSGMISLHDNMVAAIGGRAPQVVGMMQALGFSMDDVRRFAGNASKALPELFDKIASIKDPSLQAMAATALWGGAAEGMLPFIRKGAAGFAEYTERAAKYGLVNADGVAAANRLREAQTSLTLAVEGLGNSIAQRLEPVLSPLLTQMADWIAKNRDWIATDIGAAVQRFAGYLEGVDWKAVGGEIQHIIDEVTHFVDALGGIVPVAETVAGVMAGAWAAKMLLPIVTIGNALLSLPAKAAAAATESEAAMAGTGLLGRLGLAAAGGLLADQALRTADPADSMGTWIDRNVPGASFIDNAASHIGLGRSYAEQQAQRNPATSEQWVGDMRRLMAAGWSREQAAGALGNAMQESAGDARAVGDNGKAYGLFQWHQDRQDQFARLFGHTMQQGTRAEQVDFASWELNHTESGAGDRLRGTTNASDAAAVVSRYYERPADADGQEAARRGAYAGQMLSLPADAGNATSAAIAANGGTMPNGQVQVGVNLTGLPMTAKTTAVQSGTGMAPLKVQRTMVGQDYDMAQGY